MKNKKKKSSKKTQRRKNILCEMYITNINGMLDVVLTVYYTLLQARVHRRIDIEKRTITKISSLNSFKYRTYAKFDAL